MQNRLEGTPDEEESAQNEQFDTNEKGVARRRRMWEVIGESLIAESELQSKRHRWVINCFYYMSLNNLC